MSTPLKPDGSGPNANFLRWVWDMLANRVRINPSPTIRVQHTSRGWILHAVARGGGVPSQPIQTVTIASEHDDYILTDAGTPVAKPDYLRRSDYETGFIDGAVSANPQNVPDPQGPFTYVGPGQRMTSPLTTNGVAYTQYIVRKYTPGATLLVCTPTGGTGTTWIPPATTANPNPTAAAITLEDLNVSSRVWCTLINDCVNGTFQSLLYAGTAPFKLQVPPKPPL